MKSGTSGKNQQGRIDMANTDPFDDEEDSSLHYDPEKDCPRCHGSGQCALLSGIEWDYSGPDYGTCPRCVGTGRI